MKKKIVFKFVFVHFCMFRKTVNLDGKYIPNLCDLLVVHSIKFVDCRFVELLWQLSLHALREVHRRTFAADVVSNPLPASLTDVAFSHAATLLPVTKVS